MRILFLAPRYPYPPHRGDQVRAYHLARGLSRFAEVTLLSFGSGPPLPVENVRVRNLELSAGGRMLGNLASPGPLIPLETRLFAHSGMRAAVRDELAKEPDVVHVTLSRMGTYLPKARPSLHRHLDLVDSLSINMRTRGTASRGPAAAVFAAEARLLSRYEARLADSADSVSLVSAADRAAPGLSDAAVIPNGIDMNSMAFVNRGDARPPVLTFFGNLGYFHNSEPARFVAQDILPLVRARVPGATLRLAGARPAAEVRGLVALEGVELAPDVPDMAAELALSTVAVLPMFSGSGLKNKVLEAFATGLPVVANPMGMNGIEGAREGVHFLTAGTAEKFADAVLELLVNPAQRRSLGTEARRLIESRYSWEHQVESLLELYGQGATRDSVGA